MKSSWRGTAFRAGSLAEAAMIDADTDPSVERGLNRMFSSRLDGCDVTLHKVQIQGNQTERNQFRV